jgi:hypothetical protein
MAASGFISIRSVGLQKRLNGLQPIGRVSEICALERGFPFAFRIDFLQPEPSHLHPS